MTTLGIVWFFLIFLLIAGYFVLDGFDLGAGVLSLLLARTDGERSLVRRAIGPVWDGNEVWLLTAGGALFAAFAPAYATTFSGFYLAIMLVLFGLIIRAVSIEFGAHAKGFSAALCNFGFFIGSFLPALLLGVAVGNIYAGIPMDVNGDYAGVPLLGLVTPFTLLCGLLGLFMFCAAGASWIALKTPLTSEIRARAKSLRGVFQALAFVMFVGVSAYGHFIIQPQMDPALGGLRWFCAIAFAVFILFAFARGRKDYGDLQSFIGQSLAAVVLVFLLAASMFPNLVVAAPGSAGASITIATAASTDAALGAMTIIACIGVPLVLIYHIIVYRTFYGRADR